MNQRCTNCIPFVILFASDLVVFKCTVLTVVSNFTSCVLMNVLTLVFAVQKLLSECQSHRDCQLPVNHLLFGKDPCPGTAKYLHVTYKCKPSEFSMSVPTCSFLLTTIFYYFILKLISHIYWHTYRHTQKSHLSLFPLI